MPYSRLPIARVRVTRQWSTQSRKTPLAAKPLILNPATVAPWSRLRLFRTQPRRWLLKIAIPSYCPRRAFNTAPRLTSEIPDFRTTTAHLRPLPRGHSRPFSR